jgi:hypothetical protein
VNKRERWKTEQIRQAWFAAAANPRSLIRCPYNNDDYLVIFDIITPGSAFDRYIFCPTCRAKGAVWITSTPTALPFMRFNVGEPDQTFEQLIELSITARELALGE